MFKKKLNTRKQVAFASEKTLYIESKMNTRRTQAVEKRVRAFKF